MTNIAEKFNRHINRDPFQNFNRNFNIMRTIALVFIAIVFVVVLVGGIYMLLNGGNISYSYNYEFGGYHYEESYNVGE